jgi:hypothetical protein
MPLSFPASPALNATSTQNGRQYQWTGYAWELVAASGSGEDALLRSIFVPAAPTGLTATAGNAQAALAWTAPTGVIAQAPITDYREQYSTDNGATWTTFTTAASTASTATVTGLTNGTAYRFRVAAVNAVGVGAYTAASAAVTPVAGDVLFASVALLLPMDGTGSTFVDASASPKTITAVGNATQSTAQSKWGGKSAYFDGSGDYVSVPDITLSGDFVFECWLRWNGAIGKDNSAIAIGSSANTQFFLTTKQNRTGLRFGLSGVAEYATGSFTWVPNTWYYVALVRSGSAIRLYVDGVNVTDGSPTAGNTFSGELRLAADLSGSYDSNIYLDDVRLTVGSDRSYTGSTITVPSASFPTRGVYEDPFFESVSLILPMDGTGNTFTDSSLTPKTVTAAGNATQSTAQSKWGGKSLALDGTGDYLSATGALSQFGTSDFAVEFWLYYVGTGVQYSIFDTRSSNGGFVIYKADDDTLNVFTSSNIISGGAISANTWHHIALARSGSNMKLFLNGTQTGSTFSTLQDYSDQLLTVGGDFPRNGRWTQGYIDDVRITKGSARGYTGSTITVPTAAFPDS